MRTAAKNPIQAGGVARNRPAFIFHSSFEEPGAEEMYGGDPASKSDESLGFMPDGETRDYTRRMHYAAWRACGATTGREASRWRRRYLVYRDRIVLGNQKLSFRAVHMRGSVSQLADDMASECQIVLIKAVASFNPWLGIRFSTYAFTCLRRALSRLSQRLAADRLHRSLPLESLPYGEPCYLNHEEPPAPDLAWLSEYFGDEHTLLTAREKLVLTRRFHLDQQTSQTADTLEQLGRDLGLSKERVRQVQLSALGKLRAAVPAGRWTS
jgi:RNA polymerase sigma factor (sigma-70 family)